METNDVLSGFSEVTRPDYLSSETVSIFSLFNNGRRTYEAEILRALFKDTGFLVLLRATDESVYQKLLEKVDSGLIFGSNVEEDLKQIAPLFISRIEDEIMLVLNLPRHLTYRMSNGHGGYRFVAVSKKHTAGVLAETILIHERNGCLTESHFRKITRAGGLRSNFCRWTLVYLFLSRKEQKSAHEHFLLSLNDFLLQNE